MMNKHLSTLTVILSIFSTVLSQTIMQPPSVRMTEPESLLKTTQDRNFLLACRSSGAPKPTIQWYKDGNDVVEDTRVRQTRDGDLQFDQMLAEYAGAYQCRAENAYGVSMSNLTKIKYSYFKNFPPMPNIVQPTQVTEGEALKLDCTYDDPLAFPTPIWSWVTQSDLSTESPSQERVGLSARVSVDDRGNLFIQNVLPGDAVGGIYHLCEAWDTKSNSKKYGSPHQLNIQANPNPPRREGKLVYHNGPDITVVEGETATLYCIFEGFPTVTIDWRKLGNSARPLWDKENGGTRLKIANTKNTAQFEGTYECVGTQPGTAQALRQRFTVNVLEKPKFTSGPMNVNITEGGDVVVICDAQADPPAVVKFLVNGKRLDELTFDPRRKVEGNKFTMTGLRRGTGPSDTDLMVLTCKASNTYNNLPLGENYMDGYINVVKNLTIITPSKRYNVTANMTKLVLECEISSDPSIIPTVSWHHKQTPIRATPDKYERANNSLIIYPQGHIEEITGEYMCVVETSSPIERRILKAYVVLEGPVAPPVTAAGIDLWWIGLVFALLLLLLIIVLIICCLRRERGQTHDVDKVERQMGNNPERDIKAGEFKDYMPKEKGPIEGTRDLEDFSFANYEPSTDQYGEDNDSLGQYAIDAYPGEYGTRGRSNPAYDRDAYNTGLPFESNGGPPAYDEPSFAGSGYGDPGYTNPGIGAQNVGYVSDEATV